MYTINFTGTGSATLDNFTDTQQKQILYVLNKLASNYDVNTADPKQIRYLDRGFYAIKINSVIRVMVTIKDNTFNIIDVFNHQRSEQLMPA